MRRTKRVIFWRVKSLLLYLFISFVMVLWVLPGSLISVQADQPSSQEPLYEVKLQNQENDEKGNPGNLVSGAKYRLQRIEIYNHAKQKFEPAPSEEMLTKGVEFVLSADSTLPEEFKAEFIKGQTATGEVANEDSGHLKLHLPSGRYQLSEISPAPGILPWERKNNEPATFDVPQTDKQGNIQDYIVLAPKAIRIFADVKITKVNPDTDPQTPIPGAEYQLSRMKNSEDPKVTNGAYEPYELLTNTGTGKKSSFTTDQQGEILLRKLPAGRYRLIETKAPKGFELNPQIIEWQVSYDLKTTKSGVYQTALQVNNGDTAHTTIYNYTSPSTQILIDDDDSFSTAESAKVVNRAQNFQYQLRVNLSQDAANYKQFQIIDDLPAGLDLTQITTKLKIYDKQLHGSTDPAEQAKADLSDLFKVTLADQRLTVQGKLDHPEWQKRLVNVRTLEIAFPVQFPVTTDSALALSNSFQFVYQVATSDTSGAGSNDGESTVNSDKIYARVRNGVIQIQKIDGEDTDKVLANVEFALFESKDAQTALRTGKTDEKGQLSFSGLDYKTYWLKETKTKTGYRLPTELTALEVQQEDLGSGTVNPSTLAVTTIKNYQQIEFPLTGTLAMIGFVVIGAIVILLALVLKRRNRPSDK